MPKSRRRVIHLALAWVVAWVTLGAHANGPDVRKLMTPEAFQAAGLDKLTPQEIDALNQWLATYTAKDAPEVRRTDPVVKAEVERTESEGIRTRVVGDFTGWTGDTVFRLENGQVWRQRLSGQWFHRADSPEVVLRKNFMGNWTLTVVGTKHSIGVTRVE